MKNFQLPKFKQNHCRSNIRFKKKKNISWRLLHIRKKKEEKNCTQYSNSNHTVDGRNPAPPGMYKTLSTTGHLPYQLVQDFFHQPYLSSFGTLPLDQAKHVFFLGIIPSQLTPGDCKSYVAMHLSHPRSLQ